MAKIKILKAQRGANKILSGIVEKVEEVDLKGSKLVNVTIGGYIYNKEKKSEEKKSVTIGFFNSDRRDDALEGRNQRADRISKMKLKPGQVVLVSVYQKDGKLYGHNAVKGSGVLSLENDIYVALGSVVGVRTNAERGVTNATMLTHGRLYDENGPVLSTDGQAQYGDVNTEISYWNSERHPGLADNASKLLSPSEKDGKKSFARIITVMSAPRESHSFTRKNGETGYQTSYTGFSFEFVPAGTSKQEEKPATKPQEDFTPLEESDELPWN